MAWIITAVARAAAAQALGHGLSSVVADVGTALVGASADSDAAMDRLRGDRPGIVIPLSRRIPLVPSSMTGPGWKSNPYFREAFRSLGPPLPGEGAEAYAARVTATTRSRPAAKPAAAKPAGFTVEGFHRRQRELAVERARARIAGR